MKKFNFNLEEYKTDKYDVVSRDGRKVIIGAINQDVNKKNPIIGWIDGVAESWTIDGKYMDGETSGADLFLKNTAIVMHINITRSKSGIIQCYGNLEKKPKLNKGTELLKYFTTTID